jgi:hypothetical protein
MIRYKEKLTDVEEFLVLALKEEKSNKDKQKIDSFYRQYGDEVIFKSTTNNKILPMVAHGLLESISAKRLNPKWEKLHRDACSKLTLFFVELDRIAAICDKKSIPIVAIENGGIARGVQQCRGCFASSDIEILVNREDLNIFEQILLSEGYVKESRERSASEDSNDLDREIVGWDNYCKLLEDGIVFWLNVQWRAILRRWIPMEQGLRTQDLIARSIPISDPNSYVRILSPEDNLLVCALHVASHSYVRGIGLRLQLDIDRLVRHVDIDWSIFVDLVKKHVATELVYPSLAIPHSLLDTAIPKHVFEALIPSQKKCSKILSLISQAGVLNRTDHKFSPLQIVKLELAIANGGIFSGLKRVFVPPAIWVKEGHDYKNTNSVFLSYIYRLYNLASRGQA